VHTAAAELTVREPARCADSSDGVLVLGVRASYQASRGFAVVRFNVAFTRSLIA
jgi:hypothetical protein